MQLSDQDRGALIAYSAQQSIDEIFSGVLSDSDVFSELAASCIDQAHLGEHLVTPRTGYTHHGIYVGNGRVIHYEGFCEAGKSAPVTNVDLDKFRSGRGIAIKQHPNRAYTGIEIVERAWSRLGENDYSLVLNNCEHFVYWCLYDRHFSPQVENVARTAGGQYGRLALACAQLRKSIRSYFKGDIDFSTLRGHIGQEITVCATASACSVLGQIAIPIPVAGAFIGMVAGYVLGHFIHATMIAQIGSRFGNKFEEQRCRQIEAFCSELVVAAKKSRQQVESRLRQHFTSRAEFFNDAFRAIDHAVITGEYASADKSLIGICEKFRITLSHTDFNDFDAMMRSAEPVQL